MARRKQLRRRPSQTSSSTSSSTSPSPSGPPSPSVIRASAGGPASGALCSSPGQTLAAARASLKHATSSVDKQTPSPAVPAAASDAAASSVPAEAAAAHFAAAVRPSPCLADSQTSSAAAAVPPPLPDPLPDCLDAAAAADISQGPQLGQSCVVAAACGKHGEHALAMEVNTVNIIMPEKPARSLPDVP